MQGYTNASASASTRLTDISVTFSAQSSPTYSNFPNRASVAISGCTSNKQATVTYNSTEALSGNYAPWCETYDGGVYLYSKVAGTVTVATIVVDQVSNFFNLESTPTQNSGNPISSGGVFTNCVRTTDDQTVAGAKTFTSAPTIENTLPQLYLDNSADDYTTSYTSVDTKNYLAFRDKNNTATAHISEYVYNGGRGLSISAFDKSSGSVKEANIGLVVPKSSSPYVTATYRTSGLGSSDVLTAGNGVTLNTVQTLGGQKVFAGELPTSQPTSGATTTPIQYKFYGGTTVSGSAYWNYANINFLNKDNGLVGFVGPIQYGSTNTNGGNGFRIGLRDRENTTWKAFLAMYDNGSMTWDGSMTASSGFIGNVTGNCSGSSSSCTGNSATASNLWCTNVTDCQLRSNWNGSSHFIVNCIRPSTSQEFPVAVNWADNCNYANSTGTSALLRMSYPYSIEEQYVGWWNSDIQVLDTFGGAVYIIRFTHQNYERRIEVGIKGYSGNEYWTTLKAIDTRS